MSFTLALAVALTVLPAPEPLVLTDGSVLHVVHEPRIVNGLAVARLPDGTVISVPAARIDRVATEKRRVAEERKAILDVESAVRAEEAKRAASESARRPGRKKSGSAVVTNTTIETYAEAEPPSGVPPATGDASVTELPGPAPEVHPDDVAPRPRLDDEGHGPEYWRERARAVHQYVRKSALDLEVARRNRQAEEDALLHGRVLTSSESGIQIRQFPQSGDEVGASAYHLMELREREREAAATLVDAKQEEADLRDEGRRLGADPGWLRIVVAY